MIRKAGIFAFTATAASLVATSASAHTGIGATSGFVHPFLGLDHVLAMLAIGLWAGQLGGRARLAVPAAFVGLMIVGSLMALAGMSLPASETGILASVVVLGLLVASTATATPLIGAVVAGGFALFHGAAHGAEIGAASALTYIAGFAIATATIHLAGLGLAEALRRAEREVVLRLAGGATAAAGIAAAIS